MIQYIKEVNPDEFDDDDLIFLKKNKRGRMI
jgi:hypothetical protein